jgi:hypothetical protein
MLKSASKRTVFNYDKLGHVGAVSNQLPSQQMHVEAEIERTLHIAAELQRSREGKSV